MFEPVVVHWLEAPPTQVPLTEKQPLDKSKPLAKVEVAEVERILRALAVIPQAKVLVAVVEVATM